MSAYRQATVTDEYDRFVPGAKIYVTSEATQQNANLSRDGTFSDVLTQPLATDEFGNYTYYASDGFYREDIYYGGRLRYSRANIAVGKARQFLSEATADAEAARDGAVAAEEAILAAAAGASVTSLPMSAASRMILKALDTSLGLPALLLETGRTGLFNQKDISSLSFAPATIDPNEGIYIVSTHDASKVWVRQVEGWINPEWFGMARGDAGGGHAAANSAVLAAMTATLQARGRISGGQRGSEAIRFPSDDVYELAGDDELRDASYLIEGAGPAGDAFGTTLRTPAGKTGLIFERSNTSGLTGTRTTAQGSDWSILRNIRLEGGFTNVEGEHHGVAVRSHGVWLDNVFISGFEGDGIWSNVSNGGSPEGNSNNCRVTGGRITACRNGVKRAGGDANIWEITGLDCTGNRQWGDWGTEFLGSSQSANHYDGNGTTPFNNGLTIGASVVSYFGNRYGVIAGQESGASTHAPSGDTTDNAYWYYYGAGGAQSGIPAWFSGILCRAGGAVHTDNNNARHVYSACYYEPGQGFAQIVWPTVIFSGMLGSFGYWKGSTGANIFIDSAGTVHSPRGFASVASRVSDEILAVTTGDGDAATKVWTSLTGSVNAPGTYRWKLDGTDVVFDYANFQTIMRFTGINTTGQFGTGVNQPHWTLIPNLVLGGPAIADARRVTYGVGPPGSGAHAKGEIVFNVNATNTGYDGGTGPYVGWMCTTAGSPGTWRSFGGQASHQANSTAVDVAGLLSDFNTLLSRLQQAGLMV